MDEPPPAGRDTEHADPRHRWRDGQRTQPRIHRSTTNCPVTSGGTLFSEPVLVIAQQPTSSVDGIEYAVYGQHGRQLGSVRQPPPDESDESLLTSLDSAAPVILEIRDATGQDVLQLLRPTTISGTTVPVRRPDGTAVGDLRMEKPWEGVRFGFEIKGERIGGIHGTRQGTDDLRVLDHQDTVVGQLNKNWPGLVGAEFATTSNYVLRLHRAITDPLLSMVIAGSLSIETTLRQRS